MALTNQDMNSFINFLATPLLDKPNAQLIDALYQDRKETLLSVDDLVKEVVSTLEVTITTLVFFFRFQV